MARSWRLGTGPNSAYFGDNCTRRGCPCLREQVEVEEGAWSKLRLGMVGSEQTRSMSHGSKPSSEQTANKHPEQTLNVPPAERHHSPTTFCSAGASCAVIRWVVGKSSVGDNFQHDEIRTGDPNGSFVVSIAIYA